MKKGFTLIELIGVIVILGIVAAFSVPALTKTLKNSADKEYNEFIKNVTLAAENYFHNETDGIVTTRVFIKVSDLINKGYLKKIVNPLTGTEVDDEATVVVYKDENNVEKYMFADKDVTENGYVQNGLVLLYDGYSAPVNGEWQDLSENSNNGQINGATWVNTYYELDGVNDYISSYLTLNGSYGTIEICSEYQNGDVILGSDIGTIYNINVDKETGSDFRSIDDFGTRGIRYSAGIYNAFFKGIMSPNASFSDTSDGTYISIGSNSPSSAENVSGQKVYSVRVYNRALSNDEIAQNYVVDKYRFGFGE